MGNAGSALEQEILERAARLRGFIWRHDRGVILGILLCIAPFPPTVVAGLLVGCLNLQLLRRGRLGQNEAPTIWFGIGFGMVNLLVVTTIIVLILHYMRRMAGSDGESLGGILQWGHGIWLWIWGHFWHSPLGGDDTTNRVQQL
jgi:hypothetical protein